MIRNEETLIQEGLTQNEAGIVLYLARVREASVKALAKTIQISVQQCESILNSMRSRGILRRKKTQEGDVYSLSSFLTDILLKDEKRPGGKPFFPPFKASKISQIIKPTPE